MSCRSAAWLLAWGVVWAVAQTPPMAQRPENPPQARGPSAEERSQRQLLDAIRQDLVELRFEKVLAALEALLGDPGMSEANWVEALVLRAQAHGAFGDLDATEEDYRLILRARPGYTPEPSLTPSKAMERFRKVRAKMIGTARVTLDPPKARLTVDGREVVLGPDGALALLGGERLLRAEAQGFDAEQLVLQIEPGKEIPVRIQLLPNSRTVVARTEPGGVSVRLDGVLVGETVRAEGDRELGLPPPPAELVLENIALGEHVFEFSKACYTTERIQDMLTVDLLDRSPKEYETVILQPSRSTMTVLGEPLGAEVRVDGEPVGVLPLAEPLQLCPGVADLEVRAAGRTVWRSQQLLKEQERTAVEIHPRPNAALLGADEWPVGLAGFGSSFSTFKGLPLPARGDLTKLQGWSQVTLPPEADLALAVLPPAHEGGRERWVLFSPILQSVEALEVAPTDAPRPAWYRPVWGMTVADSRVGDPARVVEVAEGGVAATAGVQVGDRVVAVSGRPVAGARAVREAMANHPAGTQLVLQLVSPAGESREVQLSGSLSPVLLRPCERRGPAAVLAAWATVDAVAVSDRAPAALANLALLLSESGKRSLAVENWRRVRWGDRRGIGDGTTSYYLARDLLQIGRESEAIDAFRRAALSEATTFSDEGPAIAPAATDHLTDLGVVVEKE